jgi:uncharacterized LabA/DUF88 family protein
MTYNPKVALFIDGANLYATTKTLGFDIDYKRLLKEFKTRGYLVRAFYYTALVEDQEYSSIRPLIDWLNYNGYTVVTKPTKEFTDSLGRRKIKGNMDIDLAIDAMEIAPHIDHMVLFSGDGDFRTLVEAIKRKGIRVSVVSTVTTQPPMISDDLRRVADEFIDLMELAPRIGRDAQEPRHDMRPEPRQEVRPETRPLSMGQRVESVERPTRTVAVAPSGSPTGAPLEQRYGIRQKSADEVAGS